MDERKIILMTDLPAAEPEETKLLIKAFYEGRYPRPKKEAKNADA